MNLIDKIIKSKLSRYHADTPSGAWESILARLPEEKKSTKPWWLFMSLVAIFAASTSAFLYFDRDINKQTFDRETTLNRKSLIASLLAERVEKSQINIPIESQDIADLGSTSVSDINTNYSLEVKDLNSVGFNMKSAGINDFYNGTDSSTNISNVWSIDRQISLEPIQIANILQGKRVGHYHNLIIQSSSPRFKQHSNSICPDVQPIRSRKSLDIYISHDFGHKILASVSDENTAYIHTRKETERSMYSFSAGMRAGINLTEKWSILSGLNYSQINEKFKYIDPESNQTREITIKDYVYQNGKIVDSVVNIQTVVIPGETQIKIQNIYKSIDIPILGQFTLLNNRQLRVSSVAGVFLNLTSTQSGMIFDRNSKDILNLSSEVPTDAKIFKNYVGVSAYGALNITYRVTPKIDVIAEPFLRMQTQSITSDAYPLTQRFNTYGLLTGVRYNF
jgi:hypothetical protein